MEEELLKLYRTMMLIETKGESTKTMATCLQFLEKLVAQCRVKVSEE